jgi:AmmeMemoRadiSam system protein B
MDKTSAEKMREPVVDGLFYPERAADLEAEIARCEKGCEAPRGKALAIVSPHAAYEKAGSLMAAAFLSAAERKIRTAVLIGPVHRDHRDEIILPESTAFSVPSGTFRVDEKSAEALLSCGTRFVRSDISHLEEHCLEVQLPFLGHYFPGAGIVPILLGRDTAANIKALGKGLYVAFGGSLSSTLFIVTTNFSESREAEAACAEADEIIALAEKKDSRALAEGKLTKRFTACGAGCLAALLSFPGLGDVRLLGRTRTISDAETRKGVEYAAMAVEA